MFLLGVQRVLIDFLFPSQDARIRQIPILWELGTIRPGNTMDLPVGIVPGIYKIQAVESHNIVFQYNVVYNTKTRVSDKKSIFSLTLPSFLCSLIFFFRMPVVAAYIQRTRSPIWTICSAVSSMRTPALTIGMRQRPVIPRRSNSCLLEAANHSAPTASRTLLSSRSGASAHPSPSLRSAFANT